MHSLQALIRCLISLGALHNEIMIKCIATTFTHSSKLNTNIKGVLLNFVSKKSYTQQRSVGLFCHIFLYFFYTKILPRYPLPRFRFLYLDRYHRRGIVVQVFIDPRIPPTISWYNRSQPKLDTD